MARFCEYCGTELQDGALICSQCGSILSNDEYAQPEVPQSVQEPYGEQYPAQEYTQDYVQPPVREEVQKPGKKKKSKKWLIPVAAVAAVVAAGAFLWQPILKMVSPQAYVGVMMNNTNSALEKRMEGTPAGILSSSGECLNDGSVAVDVTYVDEYEGEMKAGVTLSSNVEDQKWMLDADISAMGVQADFSAYMDSNVFAIGSDALTGGKYYGLTYDSFESDLRASAFGEMLDDEDIEALTLVVDTVDNTIDTVSKLDERLQPYMDVLTEYVKGLESKNGSEKIELDGKQRNCSTVAFTVDQDDMVNMLGDMVDLLEDEQDLKDLVSAIEGGDSDTWAEAMDSVRDALDQVDEMIKAEAVVTYYVYNSKVVDVKVEILIENPNGDEEIEVELDVCFGANPKKSDIICEVSATVDGEKVNAKVVTSDGWDGDVYKSTTSVTAKAAGEKLGTVKAETKWNKESGKLTMTVAMDDEELSCSMKLVETKNGCELSIDDLYSFLCEIDPDLAEDEFDCSVKLTFTEGASFSTPKFTNLDDIDQAALEGIMEDVQSFVTKNEDIFGGSYEDDYVYDDDYIYEDVYADSWI